MSLESVNYFTANGLEYVTNGIFEANGGGGYAINQNYNTSAAGIPAYTMRSGHYLSDAAAAVGTTLAEVRTAQIQLLNNSGGSLVLTPWAGHMGESATSGDSYRVMAHHGGASTLTFKNYNTLGHDIDGSVIYITAGAYTLRGATNTIYNSGAINFATAKNAAGQWVTSGSAYGTSQYLASSYIYFDNNRATNGGAIYNAEGSLTLERVVFGARYDENNTGTEYDTRTLASQGNHAADRGGAIYNGKTLSLSAISFLRNTAAGAGLESGGGALYNTTQGVVTGGGITSSFAYNTANQRGGAVYNAGGQITLSAMYENNSSLFGGAVFNAGTYNFGTSTSGAMEFNNNSVTVNTGRGGAVYNDSNGTAIFNGIRFYNNTALGGLAGTTGGLGGAIYNQNIVNLTNVQFLENKAFRGGGIYNDASGAVTTVSGVTFTVNEASEHGGAIYNTQGQISLSGTTFTGNTALNGLGGAIYTYQGTIGFTSTDLTNNSALEGGGIYNNDATLNIASGTFNRNHATTTTPVGGVSYNGGAIYNNGTINISGTTSFDGNDALLGVGGAIYNAKLAEINLTNNNLSRFQTNKALEGGAIYNDEGGRLSIVGGSSRVNFSSNEATTGRGGAVYSSLDATLSFDNAWFTSNTAATDGGAIYSDERGTLTITGGQFATNNANRDGGAIYNGAEGVLTITDTVFTLNTTGNHGGAIYNDVGGVLTLNDVSFTKNTATVAGGAVYNNSATININIGSKTSTFGDGTAGADTVYFTGTDNVLNVDVANTTYKFTQFGSMIAAAGSEVEITKTGVGIWEQRTTNTFSGDVANFTVEDGTLHMYSTSHLDLGGATVNKLELAPNTNFITATTDPRRYGGTPSLILQSNSLVTTDQFVTQEGSSIVAGIVTIPTGTPPANASFTVSTAAAFVLGPTAGGATSGNIRTSEFLIDGTTNIVANAFTFQSGASLNYENSTLAAASGSGPILILRPTLPNTGVTMSSDIRVTTPDDFLVNNYGYVVLAEVTNNGYFNTNNNVPTTGLFYVDGVQTAITQFTRSATPDLYKGLTVSKKADNTGSQIIFAMADRNAKSDDLTWMGTDTTGNTTWDSIDTVGQPAKTNWSGTIQGGIPVNQFMYGDTVWFTDAAAANRRTVDLSEDVTVNSMYVTPAGTGYVFNLNRWDIAADAAGTVDFGTATLNIQANNGAPATAGSTITAGTINLGTGSTLVFDTLLAVDNDRYLELTTTTTSVIDVASDIYVDTPTATFNDPIVLVETTNGTLTQTGDFYVDGRIPQTFVRSAAIPTRNFFGIDVIDNNTKIVLTMVSSDDSSTNLTWAGEYPIGTVGSLWTHDNQAVQNWRGTVKGNPVTTFLDGDTVTFADTFNGSTVNNKRVNVGTQSAPGNVSVGDMFVTGSDYMFDLTHGTISATIMAYDPSDPSKNSTGSIDFGDAAIINGSVVGGTTTPGVTNRTLTAAGTISFANIAGFTNDFTFDLTGRGNGDKMLILNAAGGVIGTIGDGDFTITNAPTLTAGQSIILVENAGATLGTVEFVKTGTINGGQNSTPVDRNETVLGLDTNITATVQQLLLKMMQTSDATTLHWSGASNVIGDVSVWNVNDAENWAGTVASHYTKKFATNDTVIFGDTYSTGTGSATANVTNKTVNIGTQASPADVTVGGLEVTGTLDAQGNGYTFNLTNGGIIALVVPDPSDPANPAKNSTGSIDFGAGTTLVTMAAGRTINAARDISFGSATVTGITGTDVFRAGRDINFGTDNGAGNPRTGAGALEFAGLATISAVGNINLADVTFGSATGAITADPIGTDVTTITAGGNIVINGGNDFYFDLDDADTTGTISMLNLNAAAITDAAGNVATIGDGMIHVFNVDSTFGDNPNDRIVLVDTGTVQGVVTGTGTLCDENGDPIEFERDRKMLELSDNNTSTTTTSNATQLLLTAIQANTNTTLDWSGLNQDGVWTSNAKAVENWGGFVNTNRYVKYFIDGDSVTFGNTYTAEDRSTPPVNNNYRNVNVTGDVIVGDMTVKADATDYTFNLTDGNITARANTTTGAVGNINFGSSTIVVDYLSDTTNRTVSAAGTITFAGNNFTFDLNNADNGDTVLTLNATGGVIGTIGNGTINVSIDEDGFSVGDRITLIDIASDNGAVVAGGTLMVNGAPIVFERGEEQFALAVDTSNPYALLLTKELDDSSSSDLRWTGVNYPTTVNNSTWNVKTPMNWVGTTIEGQPIHNFMTGDTVTFGDEAANKTVNVAAGGVTVGNMIVEATPSENYTFNLADGGITAQANATTGAAGDINFGSANITGLAADGISTVTAARDINFSGATIGLNVGPSTDDPVISAGRNITGNATLNIDSFSGNNTSDPTAVMEAGTRTGTGNLDNFNFTVTIGGQYAYEADYISIEAYQGAADRKGKDQKKIYVEMGLTWYSTDPNRPAHGDFDIASGSVEINTILENNTTGPYDRGWDGTTLTKDGNGTLILNGNNTYDGGTTINGGKLVAGHENAVGDGDVTINGANKFEVAADGTFDNAVHGTNAKSEVIFGSDNDTLTLTGNSDYAGETTISTGTVRLESSTATGLNDENTKVTIIGGAALELAFGVAGDACASKADTVGGEYHKQITGDGDVTIDVNRNVNPNGNVIVLTNADNDYRGITTINSGASLIADVSGALGDTSKIAINGTGANAGTFTIGFSGAFDRVLEGTGKLYINPGRDTAGTGIVTLSGSSSGFYGDTEICSGTAKLANIDGLGDRDTASTVTLRDNTVLDFAVGGDFNKRITDKVPNSANAGTVVKSGGGKLTLHNGDSDYVGGTTITGGELVAGHTNAVGGAAVTLAGSNVTFSVLVDAENGGNTFSNRITDNGTGYGKVNFGSTEGTLLVDSTNFDFTGKTTITDGTVDLTNLAANNWNTGAYELAVNEAATLIVSAAGDLNRNLTGDGTFEKTSTGELFLNGENSGFTGKVDLKEGTTTLGSSTALGDLEAVVTMYGNSTLRFLSTVDYEPAIENDIKLNNGTVTMLTDTGVDVTLGGEITGNATLTKTGDGWLRLTNEGNSFNRLNIDAGRLVAEFESVEKVGSIKNSATMELIVNEDKTLFGGINSENGVFIKSGNGKLDMGTSYSPFKAAEFVLNGGKLEIQLDPRNTHYVQADKFTLSKETTIIGTYNSVSGLYRGSERAIRFLALDGVGSGAFEEYSKFSSTIARVNGNPVFDADGNKLFFELWLDSFIDAYGDGLSENAAHAADAADGLAADDPLMEALTAYEDEGGDMRAAFSSLHGEVYMSSIFANADLQRNFNQLIANRRLLCEHCKEFKQFRGQDANIIQRELWATFTGGGNFRTEFDRFSGYNIGRWGIAGGLEHNFARGFFTGVALGYDQADLDLSDLPQKDQFYAFRVSAYTNYTIADVSMTGFLGYSKNWHDVERNINFLDVKSRAKYDDDVLTAGFDIAKTYHWNNINIIPTIGMSYVHIRTPFITETKAGVANLYVHSDRYDSLRVPMGVRTNSTFDIQGVAFTPEFRAFYVPELANDKVRGYTAFASAPGNSFLVDTGVRGRNGFQIGIGLQAQLFDFMSIGVDYDAEIWSRYSRHDVGANIKLRW